MKERPIIMGTESIRAILAGRKSQTRRVIRPQPWEDGDRWLWTPKGRVDTITFDDIGSFLSHDHVMWAKGYSPSGLPQFCPFGVPGDRLWVKEVWKPSFTEYTETGSGHGSPDDPCCGYKATMTYTCGEPIPDYPITWKSPIYMPKRFARIWLEVVSVRVEQLQAISDNDVTAEGLPHLDNFPTENGGWGAPETQWDGSIDYVYYEGAQAAYKDLWDSLHVKPGYTRDKNNWVWVVSFKVDSNCGQKHPVPAYC